MTVLTDFIEKIEEEPETLEPNDFNIFIEHYADGEGRFENPALARSIDLHKSRIYFRTFGDRVEWMGNADIITSFSVGNNWRKHIALRRYHVTHNLVEKRLIDHCGELTAEEIEQAHPHYNTTNKLRKTLAKRTRRRAYIGIGGVLAALSQEPAVIVASTLALQSAWKQRNETQQLLAAYESGAMLRGQEVQIRPVYPKKGPRLRSYVQGVIINRWNELRPDPNRTFEVGDLERFVGVEKGVLVEGLRGLVQEGFLDEVTPGFIEAAPEKLLFSVVAAGAPYRHS